MTMHPATRVRCFALCLGALVALGLIEYAIYPDLSWRISQIFFQGEADGSTLRYSSMFMSCPDSEPSC
jgi:hypothetical protein